ncbi:hypothetical protein VNO78_15414 [Psophocarpus tetragonolobus]|uniref:Cytochrome P450 n=1 Tax=Psophocarpus tetragonolobus TaxID=3891 RepID=A0AAN9XJW4_PSOTE
MDYKTLLLPLITFVCASILIFGLRLFNHTPESRKLPPGPRPFPIIGNIFELGTNPHKSLTKLSRIYGPIMTLKLGSITTIVISSPQIAKQILHEYREAFCDRTIPCSVHVLDHHKYSLVWQPRSARWRNLRRICATKVFSSRLLDSTQILRQQKVQRLVDYIKERCNKGEVVDIGEAVFTTALSTISNTFFSLDLSHSTPEKSQEFRDIIWAVLEEAGRPNVADFFPILRPFDRQRVRARMMKYFNKLCEFIDGIIEERMCSRASKSGPREWKDVLDSLLDIVEDTNSQWSRRGMLHLKLFVCIHQFHLPRKCDEMVNISGFKVPKNAQIFINVWAMGRDPTIWKNPKMFMPERFLECEIDFKGHDFELIPFGAGKRICPGLPLAHRIVHLIVASLVHNFEWKLADGLMAEHMNMKEQFMLTIKRVQPLQVQAISFKHD